MNLQFKNTDGGIYPALQERIERKLAKLSPLADTKEQSALASFELSRSVGSHQTGEVWLATLNIDAHGARFYAKELAQSPEQATEKVLKEVRTELKKARGKRKTLVRRGGALVKALGRRLTRT